MKRYYSIIVCSASILNQNKCFDVQFFKKYARNVCVYMKRDDLAAEYFEYQCNRIKSPTEANDMENRRMKPRRSADKLIIFGSNELDNCLGAELMPTLQDKWTKMTEVAGLKDLARIHMSVAYRGNYQVVITGGIGKTLKRVSAPTHQLSAIFVCTKFCAFYSIR